MSRILDRQHRQLRGTTSTVLSCIFALGIVTAFTPLSTTSAQAQAVTKVLSKRKIPANAQLLLEADELVYDNDNETVVAIGNVQIAYGGYTLVANKVTYNRRSGRVIAVGDVEILEPSGNRIFAEEIDVTDDFQDGFVDALNVEAADNTRIAAESAERRDGEFTIFNNGVYTACKKCEENPEKPPIWQIRAKKVTINNNTRAVEYENASFEFFGVPVISLARFSHADPAVKRKTGWLIPTIFYKDKLGTAVKNQYFFNLAPNFDLTLGGTYYSDQGFLGEAEWRHRVANGNYSIKFAGIDQQDTKAFEDDRLIRGLDDRYSTETNDVRTFDELNEERYALMTKGKFAINNRWNFGWKALFQTDNNFARTYDIDSFKANNITNEVYLTGLGEKNYFDLRAQDFLIQGQFDLDQNTERGGVQTAEDQQADVLPVLDYNAVSSEDFEHGEVSLDVNFTNVRRDTVQRVIQRIDLNGDGVIDPLTGELIYDERDRHHGIEGEYSRFSTRGEWKNAFITDGGAVVTGTLGIRADAINYDSDNQTNDFRLRFKPNYIETLLKNESIVRTMPVAAFEIRYPLIARTEGASHIFEPIAQVIARPDESHIGEFPNEDAQSFVFDATTLFDLDKFSGYDRVEGGSRANIGFRYSTNFESGASFNLIAGQSFHLSGQNSFAERDLVNAGLESGLETDRSDYVAAVSLDSGQGASFIASGRFDESDFELKRGEIGAKFFSPGANLSVSYIFTDAQPEYALQDDRQEILASASVALDENWRLSGNATYDFENETVLGHGVGLAYSDDCYSFSVNYADSKSRFTGDTAAQTVTFKFGFRTIGEFAHSRKLSSN